MGRHSPAGGRGERALTTASLGRGRLLPVLSKQTPWHPGPANSHLLSDGLVTINPPLPEMHPPLLPWGVKRGQMGVRPSQDPPPTTETREAAQQLDHIALT